jgi:hypothetical protein
MQRCIDVFGLKQPPPHAISSTGHLPFHLIRKLPLRYGLVYQLIPETNNDNVYVPPSPPIVQQPSRFIAANRPKRNIAPPNRLI